MARRVILASVASALVFAGLVASASAASPIRLYLNENDAFHILGHWCGGIKQSVYVRGFGANGYPIGNATMSTTCGGSGRGGGGGSTTYRGSASVEWTWFGETRSYGALNGPLEATPAEDSHGDKVYNNEAAAYLETGNPPLQPPAPPSNVSASVALSDEPPEDLRLTVGWSVAPETAVLVKSATVTATPVGSTAPVLTGSIGSYFSSMVLQPLEPSTTYKVTVQSTDSEGTSEPSAPVEVRTPNSDGEAEKEHKSYDSCTSSSGTIKLTPGLTEKPAIQAVTVTGQLSGCSGPNVPESGSYVDHLKTTEALTCSALTSSSTEPTKSAGTGLSITWSENEGVSKGTLLMPVSESSLTGVSGSLKAGGPFGSATPIKASTITESFTGASMCGVPQGKLKVEKPVKLGTFTTSEVEFR